MSETVLGADNLPGGRVHGKDAVAVAQRLANEVNSPVSGIERCCGGGEK